MERKNLCRLHELRTIAIGLEQEIHEKRRAIVELRRRQKKIKKIEDRPKKSSQNELKLQSSQPVRDLMVSARDVMAAVDGVYLVLGRDPRKTLTSWVRGVLIRRRKKRFDKAKSQMHRRVVLSLFPQPRKHNMDTKKVALNIGFKTWHLFVQRQKEIENAEKTSFNYEQHNTNDDVIFSSVMERRSLLHSNAKKINMPQRRDFDNKNAMNRQDERYNQKLEIPLEFSAGPRRWLSRYLQRIIGAWRELTIEIRSKRWALLQCWHSLSRRWRFVAFGEWRRQAAAESARILLAKTITTIWARSRLAQIFTDWKLVQKCDDPKNLTEILRNESKLLRAHLRELTYLAEHHQSAAAELEDVTQRWQKRSLGESPATIAVGHKDLHDLSRRVDDARYLLHLFPPATFPDHSIPEEKKSIHQSEIDQEKDTSSIMEADDATEYIAPSRQQEIQVNFDEIFPQDISLSPKEIEDEIKGEKIQQGDITTSILDLSQEDYIRNVCKTPPTAAKLLSNVRKLESSAPPILSKRIQGIPLLVLADTSVQRFNFDCIQNRDLSSTLDDFSYHFRHFISQGTLPNDVLIDIEKNDGTARNPILSMLRKELDATDHHKKLPFMVSLCSTTF